jgi:hypothetical protein
LEAQIEAEGIGIFEEKGADVGKVRFDSGGEERIGAIHKSLLLESYFDMIISCENLI